MQTWSGGIESKQNQPSSLRLIAFTTEQFTKEINLIHNSTKTEKRSKKKRSQKKMVLTRRAARNLDEKDHENKAHEQTTTEHIAEAMDEVQERDDAVMGDSVENHSNLESTSKSNSRCNEKMFIDLEFPGWGSSEDSDFSRRRKKKAKKRHLKRDTRFSCSDIDYQTKGIEKSKDIDWDSLEDLKDVDADSASLFDRDLAREIPQEILFMIFSYLPLDPYYFSLQCLNSYFRRGFTDALKTGRITCVHFIRKRNFGRLILALVNNPNCKPKYLSIPHNVKGYHYQCFLKTDHVEYLSVSVGDHTSIPKLNWSNVKHLVIFSSSTYQTFHKSNLSVDFPSLQEVQVFSTIENTMNTISSTNIVQTDYASAIDKALSHGIYQNCWYLNFEVMDILDPYFSAKHTVVDVVKYVIHHYPLYAPLLFSRKAWSFILEEKSMSYRDKMQIIKYACGIAREWKGGNAISAEILDKKHALMSEDLLNKMVEYGWDISSDAYVTRNTIKNEKFLTFLQRNKYPFNQQEGLLALAFEERAYEKIPIILKENKDLANQEINITCTIKKTPRISHNRRQRRVIHRLISQNFHGPPLWVALQIEDVHDLAIYCLIENGADICLVDPESGDTCFHMAYKCKRFEVFREMLKFLAKDKTDLGILNHQNNEGKTVLHLMCGDPSALALANELVKTYKADVNIATEDGMYPYDFIGRNEKILLSGSNILKTLTPTTRLFMLRNQAKKQGKKSPFLKRKRSQASSKKQNPKKSRL